MIYLASFIPETSTAVDLDDLERLQLPSNGRGYIPGTEMNNLSRLCFSKSWDDWDGLSRQAPLYQSWIDLLYSVSVAHKNIHSQTCFTLCLLHTKIFIHRPASLCVCCTQKYSFTDLLHSVSVAHKNIHSQTCFTLCLLHTKIFIHRPASLYICCTQKYSFTDLLHSTSVAHKNIHSQP